MKELAFFRNQLLKTDYTMGVIFNFGAFKTPKQEDRVDAIADYEKSFSYYFGTELEEYLPILKSNYHLDEQDLDFLIQTDNHACSGIQSPFFFKATTVLQKFNRFKEVMKSSELTLEDSDENLYDAHQAEFEEFTVFFAKYALEDYWIQGYWS
jgi:hypothetical protein